MKAEIAKEIIERIEQETLRKIENLAGASGSIFKACAEEIFGSLEEENISWDDRIILGKIVSLWLETNLEFLKYLEEEDEQLYGKY